MKRQPVIASVLRMRARRAAKQSSSARLPNFLFRLTLAALPPLFACCTPAAAADLNLQNYHLTFQDNFTTLNISAYGPGSRWIAHTPWNGDFGAAKFGNPGSNGPFSVTKQGLAITASQDSQGHWQAGLLSSMDMDGPNQTGFAQKYGYFEIRAKLPCGDGVWPAFWLIGVDTKQATSELDVFEYYGRDNAEIHSTEHIWVRGKDHGHNWKVTKIPGGSLCDRFNTYGVMITASQITYYLNGQSFWTTPTPPEYRQPMYMLVNLALGGGSPIDGLTSPQVMTVQYVRAYQKTEP